MEALHGPVFSPDSPLVHDVVPAVNVEPRAGCAAPNLLILHYTGMASAERAVAWLACAQSRVSCHYVVDEGGRITQLVAEGLRAWHAGVSSWAGVTDVNSASIGIEIHNPGHEDGYPDFPPAQMTAVTALSADIARRRAIRPRDILAHSDVAPSRKIDPGEKFDWRALHRSGVGHWVEPVPVDPEDLGFEMGHSGSAVLDVQRVLARYGYRVAETGILDRDTSFVLRAFQLHFRPARVDGRLDMSTLETARRLLADGPQA